MEFGCGNGQLWAANAARIPEEARIILSDNSPAMIQAAKEKLASLKYRFPFMDLDIEGELPFDDGTFDYVIANHMLYHVVDIDTAIKGVRRILKPTGTFFVATNRSDHLKEMKKLFLEFDDGLVYPVDLEERFNLGSGGAYLERYFSRVVVREYENLLRINKPDPIIQYALSIFTSGQLTGRLDWLRDFLQRKIEEFGAIEITPKSGIFLASA